MTTTGTTKYETPNGLDEYQVRTLAEFFISNPTQPEAYLWEDGTAHAQARLGANITYCVSRLTPLRYSRGGSWVEEIAFLDKLASEDAAWAAIWEAK